MAKIKVNTVILTDLYPDLILNEIKYLDSVGHSFVLICNKLHSKKVTNNILKFDNRNAKIRNYLTAFRLLISSNEIFNLRFFKVRTFVFQLKVAFVWALDAARLVDFIEEKVDVQSIGKLYSFWGDHRALAIIELGRKYDIETVVRMHGWDLYEERHSHSYLPFRRCYSKSIDNIVFISANGKEYFEKKYGRTNTTSISYLGTYKYPQKLVLKEESDTILVVSCSNFAAVKRVDLLLEAMLIVQKKVKVEWIHFGGGIELAKFQRLCENNPNFHFAGSTANEEIHGFYAKNKVDLFVNTSETEGLPVSIMEAISYGIPILATDVGGVSEIVENGVNGSLLNANLSSAELADAIVAFVHLPQDQKRLMREASHRIWEERFDGERNYGEFVEILNQKTI